MIWLNLKLIDILKNKNYIFKFEVRILLSTNDGPVVMLIVDRVRWREVWDPPRSRSGAGMAHVRPTRPYTHPSWRGSGFPGARMCTPRRRPSSCMLPATTYSTCRPTACCYNLTCSCRLLRSIVAVVPFNIIIIANLFLCYSLLCAHLDD